MYGKRLRRMKRKRNRVRKAQKSVGGNALIETATQVLTTHGEQATKNPPIKIFEFFRPKYIKGWGHMDMSERVVAALKQCNIIFQEEINEANVTMRPWKADADDLWVIGIV